MADVIDTSAAANTKPKKKLGLKLVIVAAPLVLILAAAALWFCGVLPAPFGRAKHAATQPSEKSATSVTHAAPVFIDLPEMVTNLNAPGRRPVYIKFKAQVELASVEDRAVFTAAQPHVVDLFQTYIREMRPEELRGSAGTYRLRGGLIARADLAMAPGRIVDILFSELLVQ